MLKSIIAAALMLTVTTAHAGNVITLFLKSDTTEGDIKICVYANAIQTNTLEIQADQACPSNYQFDSVE